MPAAKPLAAHEADGTLQPCRHANRIDAEYSGAPRSDYRYPDDKEGQAAFDFLMSALPVGVLAKADELSIVVFCRAYSEWIALDMALQTTSHGTNQYELLQKQWQRAVTTYDSFAKRFGLTPGDRSRIKLGGEDRTPKDPLEQELAERQQLKIVS